MLHERRILGQMARRVEAVREGSGGAPGALGLADPRSDSLVTNFAAQWLFLRDIDAKHPDEILFPNFDETLRDALRRETELFIGSIVILQERILYAGGDCRVDSAPPAVRRVTMAVSTSPAAPASSKASCGFRTRSWSALDFRLFMFKLMRSKKASNLVTMPALEECSSISSTSIGLPARISLIWRKVNASGPQPKKVVRTGNILGSFAIVRAT